MLNFSFNCTMRGYGNDILRIATINKYCYNNEINKTATTDRLDINGKA